MAPNDSATPAPSCDRTTPGYHVVARPGVMPHVLVSEPPGSSLIRASPVRKAFGGQVMGSTARLRRRRASGSVSPVKSIEYKGEPSSTRQRDAGSVVRINGQPSAASEAILVPYEVGECVVERRRADLPRLPEIVFRILHGFPADRKAALVGPQDASTGMRNIRRSTGGVPTMRYGCSAAPVGTRVCADIRGRCPHPKAAVRQRIFDAKPEKPRGNPVAERGCAPSRPGVARGRRRTSGRGRGSRCGVAARSAAAGGGDRRTRSCHLAAGSATGSGPAPGPKSSSRRPRTRRRAPGRRRSMSGVRRRPRQRQPADPRLRSRSARRMARSPLASRQASRVSRRSPSSRAPAIAASAQGVPAAADLPVLLRHADLSFLGVASVADIGRPAKRCAGCA